MYNKIVYQSCLSYIYGNSHECLTLDGVHALDVLKVYHLHVVYPCQRFGLQALRDDVYYLLGVVLAGLYGVLALLQALREYERCPALLKREIGVAT